MPYSAVWSEAVPAGSLAASDLDQAIRDAKRDIRERVTSLLGMADWNADPLVPVSLTLTTFLAAGALPAQAGTFRGPNNATLVAARNALNTADIVVSKVTAANLVELGGGAILIDPATGFAKVTGLRLNMINNAAITWRNQANTQDILALDVDVTNTVRVGDDANTAGVVLGSNTKKVGFFSSSGTVIATVAGAKGGNTALTSLMTALVGYGFVIDTTT